jgi:hypothetical protein
MTSFTISLLVQHGSMTCIETVLESLKLNPRGEAQKERDTRDNNQHTCMSSFGNVEHQTYIEELV